MIEKIKGVVIKTIRHNDKSNIVTLFTQSRGRVAFISAAGSSKTGRLRNAALSPLAIVESDVNFHAGRELQTLGRISSPHPWRNIYFDPIRSAMVMFLSEFLNSYLKTAEPEPALWGFIVYAIDKLDTLQGGLANYHLTFLIRLLPFAGIEPDMSSYSPGRLFNMRDGSFSDFLPLHRDIITPQIAKVIPTLARMNFRNMHLYKLNVESRREILRGLMHYYSLHLPIKEHLESIEILKELFS